MTNLIFGSLLIAACLLPTVALLVKQSRERRRNSALRMWIEGQL